MVPPPSPAERSDLFSREHVEQQEELQLHPLATVSRREMERPHPEPPDPFRTPFVRDRDRVLHCGAFRRLKDKTQVFVIDEGDFYRTRLTHTLEVSQLARYLCRALRLNEALGEALALVHDIGHPPFGHEGERVLDQRTDGGFDHNLQALRIVDLLEAPYADRPGLNLTHMLRRMILKHGGEAGHGAAPTLGHVLEAQAADLADSTAYQHHDLEDGLRSGILELAQLDELALWRGAVEELGHRPASRQDVKATLNLMLKATLADALQTSSRAMAQSDATDAHDIETRGLRLVTLGSERARGHAELSAFLHANFYRHPRVLRSAATAQEAISSLVESLHDRLDTLPPIYGARLEEEGPDRAVCDYVAGMTDRFAYDLWQELVARGRVSTPSVGPQGSMAERVSGLQSVTGYVFRDAELAVTALTHSSARSGQQAPNERLEFLGDSVLGLVIGLDVYEHFPDRPEGELSRIKSATVSRHALHTVAERWGLGELLALGPGFRTPDEVPPSLAADGVEAVLGAIFLDGGLEAVRRLILREFRELIRAAAESQRSRNAKSELQAFTQGELSHTPHYRVLTETGPDHHKTFTVAVVVDGVPLAVAAGRNKRQAEQRAARKALNRLRSAVDDDVPLRSELASLACDLDTLGDEQEGAARGRDD